MNAKKKKIVKPNVKRYNGKKKSDITTSSLSKKEANKIAKEKLKWDDLILAKNDSSNIILKQMMLFSELVKTHKDIIENDTNLFQLVDGVFKTFKDLSTELNNIALRHAVMTKTLENGATVPVKFKKGIVDTETDDEFDYLGIASNYIAIDEKVAYIASTSYIDIFTKLKLNTSELQQAVINGNEAISDIHNAINNVTKQNEENNNGKS